MWVNLFTNLLVTYDATSSAHGVLFIKYASVLLQAMTLRADEDFLFALLDFSRVQGASWDEETPE